MNHNRNHQWIVGEFDQCYGCTCQLNMFEDYLRTIHTKECPEVLDDNLPDDFERWLETKDVNDIIEYGNKFFQTKNI